MPNIFYTNSANLSRSLNKNEYSELHVRCGNHFHYWSFFLNSRQDLIQINMVYCPNKWIILSTHIIAMVNQLDRACFNPNHRPITANVRLSPLR